MENKNIFELIEELCPDGVEFDTLGNVTTSISTGLNPRTNFVLNDDGATLDYVTVKEMTSGKVIISDKTDKITQDAWNIIQKRSKIKKGSVLLSGIGTIGKVAVVLEENKTWNCSESVYVINVDTSIITPFYFRYVLESASIQMKMTTNAQGSTLKGIRQSELKLIEIPIPPIEIQEEIVRILDKFTELTAELTAELTCRKMQYEHYRDSLLTFGDDVEHPLNELIEELCPDGVEYRNLESIFSFCNGKGHEKAIVAEGKYIVVNSKFISTNGQVVKYSDEQICPLFKNDILMVMSDLPNGRALAKTFLVSENDMYTLNQRICSLHLLDENVNNAKFFNYILNRNVQLLRYDNGVDQTNLKKSDILSIKLPIPPLPVQEEIVRILDRFDSLCNDITQGLPAEIEARQQQYEFFRDKLLTFKRKEV